MPETLDAVLLGVTQGLTEFLPVSSSGHIAVFAWLFGVEEAGLGLSIVLHVGTLLSTLIVFRKDVAALVRAALSLLASPKKLAIAARGEGDGETRMLLAVILGTIPAVIVGLGFKDAVEALAQWPLAIACAFAATALLLLSTKNKGDADRGAEEAPNVRQSLLIGLAQAFAITPGISRSGSTIAIALMLGMGAASAFRFSFLLSLPAVGGAALLLLLDASTASVPSSAWLGGTVAFFVGLAALVLLKGVVHRGRLWYFALYLLPLAVALAAYDMVGSG